MDKKKISIGAGSTDYGSQWHSTDIDTHDITIDSHWKRILFYLKLDNIMAEHVWEHLTDDHTKLANNNCFKYLKSGGTLRLAVPDGYNPDKQYIEHVRPGGTGPGADDHKILYNYKTMTQRLEDAGFVVELLEYWDENGKFHYKDWADDGGHISRSRRYDPRNVNGQLNYTSLIVDARKP
jgi:predicted SAM-dependent methyltransferase